LLLLPPLELSHYLSTESVYVKFVVHNLKD